MIKLSSIIDRRIFDVFQSVFCYFVVLPLSSAQGERTREEEPMFPGVSLFLCQPQKCIHMQHAPSVACIMLHLLITKKKKKKFVLAFNRISLENLTIKNTFFKQCK